MIDKEKTMGTKKKNNIVKGIIYVLLVILSIIFMLPIIWLFANSLKSHEQIFAFSGFFQWNIALGEF